MKRIQIAQRIINKSNLLIINAVIEDDEVIRERFFFEFYKGYNRSEAIKIALSSLDVRSLAVAIKENIKRGSTDFKKYTESNNIKKQITINKTYLNAAAASLKIAINFNDFYEMNAFSDELTFLVEFTLKEVFKMQRKEI